VKRLHTVHVGVTSSVMPRRQTEFTVRPRFFVFLLVVVLVASVLATSLSGVVQRRAEAAAPHERVTLSPVYIQVEVERGDTLWSIALRHQAEGSDPRPLIHRIRALNNLASAVITPGQIINVPIAAPSAGK
jgi:hypothetical protein